MQKDELPALSIEPAYCFQIVQDGEMLVTIQATGTLIYGPGYTPDAAARIFWEAIANYVPAQLAEMGKHLAAVTKERDDATRLLGAMSPWQGGSTSCIWCRSSTCNAGHALRDYYCADRRRAKELCRE